MKQLIIIFSLSISAAFAVPANKQHKKQLGQVQLLSMAPLQLHHSMYYWGIQVPRVVE